MDLFILKDEDPHGIETSIKDMGIVNYESYCSRSNRQHDWYEESGMDIRSARLVVILVTKAFLQQQSRQWGVNVAVGNQKNNTILVLFTDPDDLATQDAFFSRWSSASFSGIYTEPADLLASVKAHLMARPTISSSEIIIEMYTKAALFDEALAECIRYIMSCRNMPARDSTERCIAITDALRKTAEICLATGNYKGFESYILEAIRNVDEFPGPRVLRLENDRVFLRELLCYYYDNISGETQKSDLLHREINGMSKVHYSEEAALKSIHLIFEVALRRFSLYQQTTSRRSHSNSDVHRAIAGYLDSSIQLFSAMTKNGAAEGFAACMIECYQRLAQYCGVIGDTAMEKKCIDLLFSMQQNTAAAPIAQSEEAMLDYKAIKAFLGMPLPDSMIFDAFISHKSEDISMAEPVYRFLKNRGKEVFLDRFSLPNLGQSEYRNAILQALDNSTHLILVCSDLAHIRSGWVAEEYNLFLDEIREGRKHGNLVLLVPEALRRQIIQDAKKSLPIQLRPHEIISFEQFESVLPDYIV